MSTSDPFGKSGDVTFIDTSPFSLPPVPRRARLRLRKKILWIFMIAVVGAIAAFFILRPSRLDRLKTLGVRAQATITAIEDYAGSDFRGKTIYFSYGEGRMSVHHYCIIGIDDARGLKVGDPFEIVYDPERSESTMPYGKDYHIHRNPGERWVIETFATIAFVAMGLIVWVKSRRYRAHHRLLREGRLATATIQAIGEPSPRDELCDVDIEVHFDAANSFPHRIRASRDRLPPQSVGKSIDILIAELPQKSPDSATKQFIFEPAYAVFDAFEL